VADVLLRRTRLGILAARDLRDGTAVEAVARTLGGELGWSESRVAEEVEAWGRLAASEGLDPANALAQ
jgi:glycerol-3-phosphate dehydrogenase